MKPRIALRLEDWPRQDRAAWIAATAPASSLYSRGSAAAQLSPRTVESRLEAMAQWLGFLSRRGELTADSALALVTPERIDAYLGDMRARGNRNTTICGRLEGLAAAIRLMDPSRDTGFIRRPGGWPLSRWLPAEPRQVTVRDHREVLALALDLYRQGAAGSGYAKGHVAVRDAAAIGILAARAPRVGALAQVRLGDIEKLDGRYWLTLPEETSKTTRSLRYPLPGELTGVLDRYLEVARPALGGNRTDALWVGTWRQPITQQSLAGIVRRRTTLWFGKGRGPHWLRTCLTTTKAFEDPARALDAATVLGHTPEVALKHYNAANGAAALIRHGKRMAQLQRQTQGLAARAFGWTNINPKLKPTI